MAIISSLETVRSNLVARNAQLDYEDVNVVSPTLRSQPKVY
jgi:hypothetical protein